MLRNYHYEFGSCLLLEHSLIPVCKENASNLNIQLLKVVQQYILGLLGNVTHCLVENLTDFPAVKVL